MLNGKQVARKWMNRLKKWMKRKAVRGSAFLMFSRYFIWKKSKKHTLF
jgi:hypothetical protein